MKELAKRMNDVKPKLFLKDCSLSDEHIITLMHAMKDHYVLQKVELPKNDISTISAEAVLTLLKDQLNNVINTQRMDRLSNIYVGVVTLSPSNEVIDQNILDEIDVIAAFLNVENARIVIRNIFIKHGGTVSVTHNIFKKIICKYFSRKRT